MDFEGGVLDKLPMTLPITASVETSSGEISDVVVNHLPEKLGWRVVFRLQPAGDKPADMRVQLKLREKHLSEEWSYVWYPNNIK
ncbi:MAG: glucan biosynthesis protein [Gammaproteobacteria bacterium]